ncbi:MAG: hypothetical protein AAFN63_00070 [Pseudomonadota bacterium]
MNSQALGELASDQEINKLFHAYGYSIPVAKDGRRLWPTKFKREMGQRMRSGKLSICEVQKTCCVSESTAYKWKKKHARGASTKSQDVTSGPASNFAEIKVDKSPT